MAFWMAVAMLIGATGGGLLGFGMQEGKIVELRHQLTICTKPLLGGHCVKFGAGYYCGEALKGEDK